MPGLGDAPPQAPEIWLSIFNPQLSTLFPHPYRSGSTDPRPDFGFANTFTANTLGGPTGTRTNRVAQPSGVTSRLSKFTRCPGDSSHSRTNTAASAS